MSDVKLRDLEKAARRGGDAEKASYVKAHLKGSTMDSKLRNLVRQAEASQDPLIAYQAAHYAFLSNQLPPKHTQMEIDTPLGSVVADFQTRVDERARIIDADCFLYHRYYSSMGGRLPGDVLNPLTYKKKRIILSLRLAVVRDGHGRIQIEPPVLASLRPDIMAYFKGDSRRSFLPSERAAILSNILPPILESFRQDPVYLLRQSALSGISWEINSCFIRQDSNISNCGKLFLKLLMVERDFSGEWGEDWRGVWGGAYGR